MEECVRERASAGVVPSCCYLGPFFSLSPAVFDLFVPSIRSNLSGFLYVEVFPPFAPAYKPLKETETDVAMYIPSVYSTGTSGRARV